MTVRTNIDIDDCLIVEAIAATGLPTKKAVVEEGLRRIVQGRQREMAIADMAGLGWDGDLEAMRVGDEPASR